MEKIELGTPDITQENIEKIAALFPDVVTESLDAEGNVKRAIDFDALRQDLSGDIVEGAHERYQFTWPGKQRARRNANVSTFNVVRPLPDESDNWNTTKNLYIEGDNLEALKVLKETYSGAFDLIYIDPPYNTGNDFVYEDDFVLGAGEYSLMNGEYDKDQNRLVKNLDTKGRFHSDWCSMIYSRLIASKYLLSEQGVLAISIGHQEVVNLVKICQELFSDKAVMPITVQTSGGKPNGAFNITQEYVVFIVPHNFEPIPSEGDQKSYSSPYHGMNLATFNQVERPNQAYPIFVNSEGMITGVGHTLQEMIDLGEYEGLPGDYVYDYSVAPEGCVAVWPVTSKDEQCVWRLIPSRLMSDWAKGYIKVVPQKSSGRNEYGIQYLSGGIISKIEGGELKTCKTSSNPLIPTIEVEDYKTAAATIPTIWTDKSFYTAQGNSQMKDLFGKKPFSYPKPLDLVKNIVKRTTHANSLILDFFSGSATTAHAVMSVNADDGGSRSYVMIQLPESCEDGSDAAKLGFSNLCEVGEERIRRAGASISAAIEEANKQLTIDEEPRNIPDTGFRVVRVDSSNFKNAASSPDETSQQSLLDYVDNVKEDRTELDLLFEVLPKFRIPYSAKIEEVALAGKRCFVVNTGQLVACFDPEVGIETIEAIAKMQPLYAVMRDSSMADDSTFANFEELFKTYSPGTVRRVI